MCSSMTIKSLQGDIFWVERWTITRVSSTSRLLVGCRGNCESACEPDIASANGYLED